MNEHVSHPIFARLYARACPAMDRGGMAQWRRELLADLRGEVVEVGAGSGANFAVYPPEVTRIVAVEPEPYLRAAAQRRAAAAAAPVEVVDAVAEDLPFDDMRFDAAVVTLVLCSVSDQRAVLGELRRVIRPGGQLRFLEHVRADSRPLARVQALLDATVWPALTGGCHTSRDTVAAVAHAGLVVQRLERFRFPHGRIPMPTAPHALGVAARPSP